MVKKIRIPKVGSAAVLELAEFPDIDQLAADEVKIKTAYSGINFADIIMRLGFYPDAPKMPFVPGYEISGIVEEVGSEIAHVKAGDRVFAGSFFGGYSSHLKLPGWQVLKLPEEMSLEQGAAVGVSFITAYVALFEEGRVRTGDKLLIDCATGALGGMIYEMLKDFPVEIVGLTSSDAKKGMLTERGWKAMTHDEFYQSDEKDFQFILNSQGGKSIKLHYDRLAPAGHLVMIGASSLFENGKRSLVKALKGFLQMPKFGSIDLMNHNKVVGGINALKIFEKPEVMSNILSKFADFDLNPKVDKVFPAEQAKDAHEYIEQKKARGKVLLSW